MRKRIAAIFLVGLVSVLGAAPGREKLNVILIMADDAAYDTLSSYGSDFFSTPRLDALARDGAKFNHCYSTPVCTPSRVEIMTGRYGIRNYVRFGTLHKDEITFGTMMKQAGYATAIAGKWQLHGGAEGTVAPDCGFDSHCMWNYPGGGRNRFWNPSLVRDGKPVKAAETDYGPDLLTKFIIDFIDEKKDKPFFVYYPMVLVHSPFVPTPHSKTKKGTKLENFRDMINYMDTCVGRIVDALEERGLREKTVVLFTTDNGTHRSLTYPYRDEQRRGEKAWATDGGTHAPLIVNCPGTVPAGTVRDDLVVFADFMPTIAGITGASLPNVTLDGRTFWPQCRGREGNPRPWIYQYYFPKFTEAARKHGTGANKNELIWAQTREYKLYQDGSFFAVADRYETRPIAPGTGSSDAEAARRELSGAIESLPGKAARLVPGKSPKPPKADKKKKKKSGKN